MPLIIKRRAGLVGLLVMTTLSCGLLMVDDFIQQGFTPSNQAELELRFVVVVWLFSLGLWLCGMPVLVTGLLIMLAVMQLIQLSHVSFFGEPLAATDLASLFTDFAEVREAGWHSFSDHWHVLPTVLIPYGALIFLHNWLPHHIRLPQSRWALIIIFLVLAAKPHRATYRDLSAFMPGPSRSGLHNSINAFSFFAVRLAFRPVEEIPRAPFVPYRLHSLPSTARHVWLIIPDSLRTNRLSLFGYARSTTPNLDRYHREGVLFTRPGIASGVATAVSLPNLLNVIREPGQPQLLRQQPHNLFRIAKEEGFKTHWISSQESKLLSHLGSRFLDISITREDHPLRFVRRHDHALVDLLGEKEWADRNFVVLNLRTAHLPYEENYDQHTELTDMWSTSDQLSRDVRQSNAYDNALRYLDDVLAEIIEQFDQLSGERYLVITGDHGQLLGERGRWGHNDHQPEVAEVPVIILSREASSSNLESLRGKAWVSHYQLGVWLSERLGRIIENINEVPGEHFIQGKMLFGDNMIQRAIETPSGLRYEKPYLLSRWIRDLRERQASEVQTDLAPVAEGRSE